MSQLPTSWSRIPLGHLAEFIMGQAPPGMDCNKEGTGTPFVKAGEFREDRPELCEWTTRPLKMAKQQDVFICVVGATCGKLNLGIDCAIGRSVAAIRPGDALHQVYLYRFLQTKVSELRQGAAGSAQGVISKIDLYNIEIPLPPLNEQRRIVAKLDNLLDRSRRAREELARVSSLVERYKQAVLASAFDEAVEIASMHAPLGELALQVKNGVSRRPENHPPGIPILKISSIRPMQVRMNEVRYYQVEEGEDLSSFFLCSGDLLFTRYNGNSALVASCGMLRDVDCSLIYPDKLIRVRVDSSVVEPEFVELLVASNQIRAALAPYVKSAAGQHGISGADLKRLSLPVPLLTRQKEIILKTKARFTRIAQLSEHVLRATCRLDCLDQGMLAKAFQGGLVPQDPNDEPASALLERLKSEASEAPKPRRGRNPKKPVEAA